MIFVNITHYILTADRTVYSVYLSIEIIKLLPHETTSLNSHAKCRLGLSSLLIHSSEYEKTTSKY